MAKPRQSRKHPGCGLALADRLRAANLTQVDLANATGLSRQTISKLISDDEASPRTIERIEDALQKSASRSRGVSKRRSSRAWATATDLVDWSNRRDAQETLPELVRRLILVTAESPRLVSFAAAEGVQQPGWDGRVMALRATAFVPEGASVWELGTGADPAKKAEDDHSKRVADAKGRDVSDTTYVFVTSRRWAQKHDWADGKRRDRVWKDVRVIDADDLETWLDGAASVHFWLSRYLGTVPEGVVDLRYWTEMWSSATSPQLAADFMTAGRDDAVKELQDWYLATRGVCYVKSESRQESIAFASAALQKLPEVDRDDALARSLIVDSLAGWRSLVASKGRLLLISTFDVGDEVAAAINAGHMVLVPLGDGDASPDNVILVPPVNRAAATKALEAAGCGKNAHELAGVARRSMSALRRRLAVASALLRPSWASPGEARMILPALFAGAWNERSKADREALSELAVSTYDAFSNSIVRWTSGADPAIRRRSASWYLVSKEDAWSLIAKFVQDHDVSRFEAVALKILTTPDPRFELPKDERWMAAIHDKRPVYSPELVKGVAETLAVMSNLSTADADPMHRAKLRAAAGRIVSKALAAANRDWRVWATLSGVLSELAEASPDEFLSSLRTGLKDGSAPISRLFSEESESFFGSAPHTGLLWALESLAWSGDHLGSVVDVLAQLASKDPGGRYANRPSASLKAIFRPWLPQTSASVAKRFAVLDALARRAPSQAWNILIGILPEFHAVGTYSSKPRWHDWSDSVPEKVTAADYTASVVGAVNRLIPLAGADAARWVALVEALPHVQLREHNAIIEALEKLDTDGLGEADRDLIWNALRKLVGNHRGFPGAQWAMGGELIKRIDDVRARFASADAIAQTKWLFTWTPELPEADAVRHDDIEGYQREVDKAQLEAVRLVYGEFGLDGLAALAREVEEPHFVGWIAARNDVCLNDENELLGRYLASDTKRLDVFARSYASAAAISRGSTWVLSKIAELNALSDPQKAALLRSFPNIAEGGRAATALGMEVEALYWKGIAHVHADGELTYIVRKLLDHDRSAQAVELIGMHLKKEPVGVELMTNVLEDLLRSESIGGPRSTMFSHYLGELLDYLTVHPDADQSKVAALEWNYLPILPHYHRDPVALHRALAADPKLFVEVVSIAFKRKSDNPDPEGDPEKAQLDSSSKQQRFERAYGLLNSWRTVPGAQVDGAVDSVALRTWVRAVREQLIERDRIEIGDELIGQVLSGAPAESDGTWPCAAVRDVIEDLASEDLESGIAVGTYNGRGVISRSIDDAGAEERAQANRFAGYASAVADTHPRTAAMLRGMASSYDAEAAHEHERRELEQDLDG